MHSHIKESYTYVGPATVTDLSKSTHRLVEERTPIIIYMMGDSSQRKKELVRDEKWLMKNLKVMQLAFVSTCSSHRRAHHFIYNLHSHGVRSCKRKR